MAHALDVERARMTLESLEADVRQEAGINQVPTRCNGSLLCALAHDTIRYRLAVGSGSGERSWAAAAWACCTAERAFDGLHLAADLCHGRTPPAWGLAKWPQWRAYW